MRVEGGAVGSLMTKNTGKSDLFLVYIYIGSYYQEENPNSPKGKLGKDMIAHPKRTYNDSKQ